MLPEWAGTLAFLVAVGLTAAKINEDFGNRGILGYAMLLVMITIYVAAVATAFA